MKSFANHLMPHEYQGLIDALRRDLRREEEKLEQEPDWSYYHYTNIRRNKRLIGLLEQEIVSKTSFSEQACGQQ